MLPSPPNLKRRVNATTKAVTEKLETQSGFEKELREKENGGELKLKDQIIGTLNAKHQRPGNNHKRAIAKSCYG